MCCNPVLYNIKGPTSFRLLAHAWRAMFQKRFHVLSVAALFSRHTHHRAPVHFFTYANYGQNIFFARNWSDQYGTASISWVLDFIFISRWYQLWFNVVQERKERVTRCFLCKLIGQLMSFWAYKGSLSVVHEKYTLIWNACVGFVGKLVCRHRGLDTKFWSVTAGTCAHSLK